MVVMRNIYVSGDEIGRVLLDSYNPAMKFLISNKKMSTYGDLLKIPAWELRSYFKNWYDYASVRDDVHAKNYSLLGEELMLGLSLDREESERLADKKLSDCYLPGPLVSTLANGSNRLHPVETIGDLLLVPYDELTRMRGMGITKLEQLKSFVHSLGTLFYDDYVPFELIPDILRENGILPIDDLDFGPETKKLLHNYEIHSVGDALRSYDHISKNSLFSQQRLASFTDKLSNYSLTDEVLESMSICSSDVVRESWDPNYILRCEMKKKLKEKNELEQAFFEKDELTRRLDYISAKINFLSSTTSNNKQLVKKGE